MLYFRKEFQPPFLFGEKKRKLLAFFCLHTHSFCLFWLAEKGKHNHVNIVSGDSETDNIPKCY